MRVERFYPKARRERHVYRRLRAAIYSFIADSIALEMGLKIDASAGGFN